MPSAAFFGLIQQLILTPNEQVGRAVIECAAHLCEGSIVYASWYSFMKEGMHTAVDGAVFLLAISDFEKFSFENDEQAKNARVSIIVLQVAAMLCPLVSEHPAYGRALKSLRNNLKQEHLFDNEDIMKIVDIVAGISMDVPVRNLNLFLSLFPFDGVGKLSLVHGAVAGDPLRKDLASFGHIFSEFFNIFVIDSFGLVGTELANFFASHAASASFFHDPLSPFLVRTGCPRRWQKILPEHLLRHFPGQSCSEMNRPG